MKRQILDFLHRANLLLSYSPKVKDRWRQRAENRTGYAEWVEKHPRLFGPDEWVIHSGRVVSSDEILRFGSRHDYDT